MSASDRQPADAAGFPERSTLVAFVFLVIVGGSNAVAVRLSNLDLPPFWGAATRFGAAALIFLIILLARRIGFPRGRAFAGTFLYGLISIGFAYGFLYYGLIYVPAGMTMVILALVPLLTILFATAHRLEPFRMRGLLGALIALTGILVSLSGQLGGNLPIGPVLALVGGAVCIAEGTVIYKLFPQTNPVATNALALTTGAVFLILLSIVAGESWTLPTNSATWASFLYLVLIGSVLLFYLYLFVLSRWSASATTYSFLLFPVSTIVIASLLTGEEITPSFLLGGALVIVGVWFGSIARITGVKSEPEETDRLQ